MQIPASHLKQLPVISLETGDPVAHIVDAIINLTNLEVLGFRCATPQQRPPLVLLLRDIRQFTAEFAIIETEDDLASPGDIIRLTNIITDHFKLTGKPVATDLGRQLGLIADYSINVPDRCVQKLYVRQRGLKSWFNAELSIDRSQIIDVTPRHVVVRDTGLSQPALPAEAVPDSSV